MKKLARVGCRFRTMEFHVVVVWKSHEKTKLGRHRDSRFVVDPVRNVMKTPGKKRFLRTPLRTSLRAKRRYVEKGIFEKLTDESDWNSRLFVVVIAFFITRSVRRARNDISTVALISHDTVFGLSYEKRTKRRKHKKILRFVGRSRTTDTVLYVCVCACARIISHAHVIISGFFVLSPYDVL